MMTATWRDVELAAQQGTTTSVALPSTQSKRKKGGTYVEVTRDTYSQFTKVFMAWMMLIGSAGFLGRGYFGYIHARNQRDSAILREPLVSGTIAETGVHA